MFNTALFNQYINENDFGHHFLLFEEIDSTNTYAKSEPLAKAAEGTVILSELQTRGRGQHARSFVMEPGTGLTFTLLLRPETADRLALLTVACAYSILQVVKKMAPGAEIEIKWPNDLLINQKKVLGVLTETVFIGNRLDRLIIGMGLNVNQRRFDGAVGEKATSLALEAGKEFVREKLLADILKELQKNYIAWKTASATLVKNLNLHIAGFGRWVGLEVEGKDIPGKYKFLGLNEEGQLQVLAEDLEIKTFSYEQVRIKIN